MFLAIDIGNSSIKFALFENNEISKKFSIPTRENLSETKLIRKWEHFIGSRNVQVGSILVSSVVPEANDHIAEACRTLFQTDAVFIDSSMFGDLNSKYEPPNAVGHDRLVNAYAALKKYGKPVIVCSFGTATTIDAVDADGTYLGGIIAPGLVTMAESLNAKTSQLPIIDVRPAKDVIGTSTESSMLSGVYYGQAGLAEKLIESIADEMVSNGSEAKPYVVATGGLAQILTPVIKGIDVTDENLMLDGLNFINVRHSN